MNITINPAETKIVEVAPATISITLTKEEAGRLASILGKVRNNDKNHTFIYRNLVDFVGGTDYYFSHYEKMFIGYLEAV